MRLGQVQAVHDERTRRALKTFHEVARGPKRSCEIRFQDLVVMRRLWAQAAAHEASSYDQPSTPSAELIEAARRYDQLEQELLSKCSRTDVGAVPTPTPLMQRYLAVVAGVRPTPDQIRRGFVQPPKAPKTVPQYQDMYTRRMHSDQPSEAEAHTRGRFERIQLPVEPMIGPVWQAPTVVPVKGAGRVLFSKGESEGRVYEYKEPPPSPYDLQLDLLRKKHR